MTITTPNAVSQRITRHNNDLLDYLAEIDAFNAITKFSIGFTGTGKAAERGLLKQERFKDEPFVLEYRIDPNVIRLFKVKFFDANNQWKPGYRREILNKFYTHFVEGAPCRFDVRLIAEADVARINLDPVSINTEILFLQSSTVTWSLIVVLVFESANDALLYKLAHGGGK